MDSGDIKKGIKKEIKTEKKPKSNLEYTIKQVAKDTSILPSSPKPSTSGVGRTVRRGRRIKRRRPTKKRKTTQTTTTSGVKKRKTATSTRSGTRKKRRKRRKRSLKKKPATNPLISTARARIAAALGIKVIDHIRLS